MNVNRLTSSWVTVVAVFLLGCATTLAVVWFSPIGEGGAARDAGGAGRGEVAPPTRENRPITGGGQGAGGGDVPPPAVEAPGKPAAGGPGEGLSAETPYPVHTWEADFGKSTKGLAALADGLWWDAAGAQIVIQAYLATPRGQLEFLATTLAGRAYESVLYVVCVPRTLDAALRERLGLAAEKPCGGLRGYRDPKKPLGPRLDLTAEFIDEAGTLRQVSAHDLVWNDVEGFTMHDVGWTYTGGRVWTDPEGKEPNLFVADRSGSVVSTDHDPDALLNNPMFDPHSYHTLYANAALLPKFKEWPFRLLVRRRPEGKATLTGKQVDWDTKRLLPGTEKAFDEPPDPADLEEQERAEAERRRKIIEEVHRQYAAE
ncbi:MAG: hypothetical protein HY719_15955, partial [Planctomycetes bacterium]|nr:hypothetical protein [Planctomycetota bacterium]